MNIEIANRLVQLRKQNNLSQEALAEKLGITRQAVSKWERAEASPDTDNLIMLARLYGVSLDELLATEEIPESYLEKEQFLEVGVNEKGFQRKVTEYADGAADDEEEKGDYGFLAEFPFAMVIAVLYVVIGACFDAWHPAWLLFLLIPIWHSAVMAVKRKHAMYVAYPVFAVFVFLCLGFIWGLWHPGWVVFLTIPLFYMLAEYFERTGGKRR